MFDLKKKSNALWNEITLRLYYLLIAFQLVTTNESLEAKIRHLNEATEDEIAKGLHEDIKILQTSNQQLETEKKALSEQNQTLQKQ